MDSYHLQCVGLTEKDVAVENYQCPYCEILRGEFCYHNGGALLVGYRVILAVVSLCLILSETYLYIYSFALCRGLRRSVLN